MPIFDYISYDIIAKHQFQCFYDALMTIQRALNQYEDSIDMILVYHTRSMLFPASARRPRSPKYPG